MTASAAGSQDISLANLSTETGQTYLSGKPKKERPSWVSEDEDGKNYVLVISHTSDGVDIQFHEKGPSAAQVIPHPSEAQLKQSNRTVTDYFTIAVAKLGEDFWQPCDSPSLRAELRVKIVEACLNHAIYQ